MAIATAHWSPPSHRTSVVALAVLALHVGLLLLVRLANPMPAPLEPAATRLVLSVASEEAVDLPPSRPPVPMDRDVSRSRQRTAAAPPVAPKSGPTITPPPTRSAPTEAGTTAAIGVPLPDEPASAPLLSNEATRRAIRDAGRSPGLAQRSDDLQGKAPRDANAALREGAERAAHGDCLKGEYAGAGLGLLSLPFLAAAAATGKCAR